MQILVLSARLPQRVGKADSFTVYHLCEYLSRRGHTVDVISFSESGQEQAEEELRNIVNSLSTVWLKKTRIAWGLFTSILRREPLQVGYYRDLRMKRLVLEKLNDHEFDAVYAHLIRTGQYVSHLAEQTRVLGMQISQTLNYSRMVKNTRSIPTKLLYTIELSLVRRYEKAVIDSFDLTFLISSSDCRSITGKATHPSIAFMPHGIDVDFLSKKPTSEELESYEHWDIVFNGDMGVATNVDSILWFCADILPLIWKQRPQTTLCIVGRNPGNKIRALALDTRITVTGAVDDLRPYLHLSRLAVDPLRIGAGLQNKLLVSMAAGLPSVCTSVANEGIAAPVPATLVVEDEPQAFASACLTLLEDEEQSRGIGLRAQQYVLEKWTWDHHHRNWEKAVRELVSGSPTE